MHVLALEGTGRKRGPGQSAARTPLSVVTDHVGKVVPKHHRTVLEFLGENAIVLQARGELIQSLLKACVAAQIAFRKSVQHIQSGAFVGLRKNHVETYDARLVTVEQLVEQHTEFVPPPRPSSFRGKAFFVDVDDHDAVVDATGHGQPQPRVVSDELEAIDEGNLVITRRMADDNRDHEQPQADAREVLLHLASPCRLPARCPRIAGRHPKMAMAFDASGSRYRRALPDQIFYGLKKNSIFTPASSMTSWSWSWCACASSALPLTTGKLAPSTWVMKNPWGRFAITATCTPGLPTVVSGLVSGSSLPALGPDRIWIVPCPPGAAAEGAAGAAGCTGAAGVAAGADAGSSNFSGSIPVCVSVGPLG